MSSYDNFFKQARKVAVKSTGRAQPKINISQPMQQKLIRKSSQEMAASLRKTLRDKKKPKRSSPSIGMISSLVAIAGLATAGMLHYEELDRFMSKIEVSLMGSAQAENASTAKADATKNGSKEAETTTNSADKSKAGGNVKDSPDGAEKDSAKLADNPEGRQFSATEINHFTNLNERKKELDAREQELARLEAELQAQKVELEKKMAELDQTRKGISAVLDEKVQADDKKVEVLVQMYSNMKPQQAAKIFETMDEDLAVEILGRMKKKNAAEVMNLIKAEKAQVFSEKYAGYRRKVANK